MMLVHTSKQYVNLPNSSYTSSSNNILKKNLKSGDENSLNLNNDLKKNNPLQNLMDQKQKIMDSKKKFLESTSKNTNDPLSIKERISEFDKQIQEIDKQINQLKIEEQKKALGVEKNNDDNKNAKTNSNAEINNQSHTQDESMNNLLSSSANLRLRNTLSTQKTLASGEKRVLNSEIKIDESRGINPIRKKEHLEDLNNTIEYNIADTLVTDAISNNNNNSNNIINNDKTNIHSEKNKSEDVKDESKKITKFSNIIQNYIDNMDHQKKENGDRLNSIA